MGVIARTDSMAAPSAEYLAESNESKILSTVGVFAFLALVTVSLRLYVRVVMLKYTGADDIVMILSMLVGIAVFVCFIGEGYHGLGRHYQAMPEHQSKFLQWGFVHSLFSLFGIALVKISVSLLLLRLVPQKHYRRFLWTIIGFLSIYTVICACTIIFSCTPIAASWDYSLRPTARCFTIGTYTGLGVTNSVFTMLTDTILAVLPIPIVMGLQINKRTKIALSIVLSLGFIAVGCGAVKTYFQWSVLLEPDSQFKDSFFVWAALELYVGIIASSLPSLRPLVAVALKSARSTLGTSNHGTVEEISRGRSNYHPSRGYMKHGDDVDSSDSSTKSKTKVTVMPSPGLSEYEQRIGTANNYFGVNSFITYDVDVERSLSGPIAMEDLPAAHSKHKSQASEGGERHGIMKTMKVVTHSESLAA